MRISDWSSDVCSSDLFQAAEAVRQIESAPSCRPAPFALGNARQMRQQVQAITETPNLACFVAQQRLCIAACTENLAIKPEQPGFRWRRPALCGPGVIDRKSVV